MKPSEIFNNLKGAVRSRQNLRSGMILLLFSVSLFFFSIARIIPGRNAAEEIKRMTSASQRMAEILESLKTCRLEKGIPIDERNDLNQTGLIGLEISSMTTSLGSLEAKRTTVNPNFAGLMVHLYNQAGLKTGDSVAVGASGSFPSLLIASLAAAEVLNLRPRVICSLGASQWGGNHPRFNMLDILECLRRNGLIDDGLLAVSLGGGRDIGEDMEDEDRRLLTEEIERDGYRLIRNENLPDNVASRMDLYFENTSDNPVRAFINIGGSWANLGIDSQILEIPPGLVRNPGLSAEDRRGVLQAMAARGIPVIHCLFIRGLTKKYGLPWDPVPLPEPGEGNLYRRIRDRQPLFALLALAYFAVVILIIVLKLTLDRREMGKPSKP